MMFPVSFRYFSSCESLTYLPGAPLHPISAVSFTFPPKKFLMESVSISGKRRIPHLLRIVSAGFSWHTSSTVECAEPSSSVFSSLSCAASLILSASSMTTTCGLSDLYMVLSNASSSMSPVIIPDSGSSRVYRGQDESLTGSIPRSEAAILSEICLFPIPFSPKSTMLTPLLLHLARTCKSVTLFISSSIFNLFLFKFFLLPYKCVCQVTLNKCPGSYCMDIFCHIRQNHFYTSQ